MDYGEIYKIEFKNKNIEGQELHIWNDVRQYEGKWKDNKINGRGLFTWIDGR